MTPATPPNESCPPAIVTTCPAVGALAAAISPGIPPNPPGVVTTATRADVVVESAVAVVVAKAISVLVTVTVRRGIESVAAVPVAGTVSVTRPVGSEMVRGLIVNVSKTVAVAFPIASTPVPTTVPRSSEPVGADWTSF